jgi:hypothetical protein
MGTLVVGAGRAAYANLKSSFRYSIASNMSETILLAAASAEAAGTPLIAPPDTRRSGRRRGANAGLTLIVNNRLKRRKPQPREE